MDARRIQISPRFVRAALIYLTGVFIVVFGYANIGHLTDYYQEAAIAAIVFGTVLAFCLGYASGSTWSVLLLAAGILIAELPDTPLARGDFTYWEGVMESLPSFWRPFTLFAFLPAWIVGRALGRSVDRSLEAPPPSPGL
jgi:hypothetical protein